MVNGRFCLKEAMREPVCILSAHALKSTWPSPYRINVARRWLGRDIGNPVDYLAIVSISGFKTGIESRNHLHSCRLVGRNHSGPMDTGCRHRFLGASDQMKPDYLRIDTHQVHLGIWPVGVRI